MTDHGHEHDPAESGQHEHEAHGVHGMLLLGDEALYLSHLPMFSAPHNFQVILEVSLDDVAQDAYLSDRAAEPDAIHTFVPEPFSITELSPEDEAPAQTLIPGDVFHGHFERGGEELVAGATAEVRSVVEFSELDVTAEHEGDRPLTYICFGHPGDLYLAHAIQARPDFDQILTARLVPATVEDMAGRPHPEADVEGLGFEHPQRAEIADRRDTEDRRLGPGDRVGATLHAASVLGLHGFRVEIELERELYFEAEELV